MNRVAQSSGQAFFGLASDEVGAEARLVPRLAPWQSALRARFRALIGQLGRLPLSAPTPCG